MSNAVMHPSSMTAFCKKHRINSKGCNVQSTDSSRSRYNSDTLSTSPAECLDKDLIKLTELTQLNKEVHTLQLKLYDIKIQEKNRKNQSMK